MAFMSGLGSIIVVQLDIKSVVELVPLIVLQLPLALLTCHVLVALLVLAPL